MECIGHKEEKGMQGGADEYKKEYRDVGDLRGYRSQGLPVGDCKGCS